MSQIQTPNKERKWRAISVPQEAIDLLNRIKSRSGQNTANWKIIVEALSFYDTFRSKPKVVEDFNMIEKAGWYITKLSMAYGAFALNPNEQNINNLKERLMEIEERLQVDTGVLFKLIDQYSKLENEDERKKFRIQMNQAFKLIVKEIILKICEQEGGEKGNDSNSNN